MARHRISIELLAIALIAAVALGFGIQNAGIASGYVDPILHAGAQDEAVYGHAAAYMVRTGQWLTPVFLDRFLLNKPPLLMWTGAGSMLLLGVNPTALRLPALAAGVLCCLLIYAWLRRSRSLPVAFAGVLLALGNGLFHSMARKFMTDIVLTLLITAAMFILALDPRLQKWTSVAGFGCLSGAAILTKSAAGLLPLLILIVFFFLRAENRPAPTRILAALGVAVLIAAPWHLYQLLVHKDWFMAEYVQFQVLGSGVNAPSRYSGESSVWFYARRLLVLDPLLLLLWCAALPGIVQAWKRSAGAWEVQLLSAWCLGSIAVLLSIRNACRLLPAALDAGHGAHERPVLTPVSRPMGACHVRAPASCIRCKSLAR